MSWVPIGLHGRCRLAEPVACATPPPCESRPVLCLLEMDPSGTDSPTVGDERGILADLWRVYGQVPLFAMEFTTGGLSVDAEVAFAHRLIDVADGILLHVDARRCAL